MKTLKSTFVLLLLLGALSCKKTNDTAVTTTVTSDQAADIAAGSLAENSYGLTSVTDNLAANAQIVASIKPGSQVIDASGANTVHQACGTTLADSVSNSGTTASVSFSYFLKFVRTLNCNNDVPDNLSNVLTFHGNYDGPRLSSNDAGSATFTIAGLSPTANSFVINGEYKRAGSFQTKGTTVLSGNSNIDIVVTALTLSKTTRTIASGHATISVTGSTPKNGAFSFAGTLVFNGDGTATLTINGSTSTYHIDLATGLKTKV